MIHRNDSVGKDDIYFESMDFKEHRIQKARVKKLVDKWVKPIGLGWWHIGIDYMDDIVHRDGDPDPIFHVNSDWKYNHATITVNLEQVKRQKDWELEQYFVHELAHILINEMRQWRYGDKVGLPHEERVATTVAKALIWAVENVKDKKESDGKTRRVRHRKGR